MREIINWLLSLEHMSHAVYNDSSVLFVADPAFSQFLSHLAADERWHYEVMQVALREAGPDRGAVAAIALDDETRRKIESPFRENLAAIANGSVTREGLLECVARTEFSEWNDIFLYVVNSLKERRRDFHLVAARMQSHKSLIQSFLERMSASDALVSTFRRIPPVWQARILVVDDYDPIREFLSAVLAGEGVIDEAVNGGDGLARIRTNAYDVVISDIDMPVMNGLQMFLEAEKHVPGIGSRFLFLSGTPESDEVQQIRARGLRFLAKPVLINQIEDAVRDVLKEVAGAAHGRAAS